MPLKKVLKKIFWKLPLPGGMKETLRLKYAEKKFAREQETNEVECIPDEAAISDYCEYVLASPIRRSQDYREYEVQKKEKKAATLIAYYLTQYSPDSHNDLWWGKGTTEWNNVVKAVPQFSGHRQPRLPGELGFYDLRIRDVMERQIEIAKNYGVDVFSFYYYWFAGERILERPLNMFLGDSSLDMPFMFCWANENWTKRFSGTDNDILIGMENSVENYKAFIHEVIPCFKDPRYFKIDGKAALQIYRPALIPKVTEVLEYWREETRKETGLELYLFACQGRETSIDWCSQGFDAENEWMQGSIRMQCKDITREMKTIRKDFSGEILDYADMVEHRKYIIAENRKKKVYPSVMPTWDNSARRNHRGVIWQNSTPELFQKWLCDMIKEVGSRTEKKELDAPIVFINAWNEWGEGAYLEPDQEYGYAYLQAVWNAKNRE